MNFCIGTKKLEKFKPLKKKIGGEGSCPQCPPLDHSTELNIYINKLEDYEYV